MPGPSEELAASIARTQARIRELESLVGMLAVRHGHHVGLGTYQLRIGQEEAFELRSKLAARDLAVIITFEAPGDLLVSVI